MKDEFPRIRTSKIFAELVKTLKKNMNFRNDPVTTEYIARQFINFTAVKNSFKRTRKQFIEPL